MIWLCNELQYAAEKGQVIKLADAWKQYEILSIESGAQIPQSYISRQSSFKEKLQSRVGDLITFVCQLETNPSERETLLIPTH